MHDIDLLLAQTDLAALADELLGQRKGSGVSAKWPSPVPGQQGTGQSPPMGIFIGRDGTQRWKDFSTGEGGTAIDLIKTVKDISTKDALDDLAQRTGNKPAPKTGRVRQRDQVGDRPTTDGTPRLNQYIEETTKLLAQPKARLAHRWLQSHGITIEHALANNVGYDPGPRILSRPRWLPQFGPAVVLPVTDIDKNPTYITSRNLRPDGPKYENPKASHTTNPTISILEHNNDGPMILTEGIADALLLTQHGHNASALIGTAITAQTQWIGPLLEAADGNPVVLAFDNDKAGHTATLQAAEHLTATGAKPSILAIPQGDLGEWAKLKGDEFAGHLRYALSAAKPIIDRTPAPTAPNVALTP